MNEPAFSEIDLVSSICRESFYEFVKEFWHVTIPKDPIFNWHIKYICDELQLAAENMINGNERTHDLIINICPGSTKSTLCSVMFPAWVWTRMAEAQFITVSYAHLLASDLSRRSRDLIKSKEYHECYPNIELRVDQDSKAFFLNNHKGFRIAMGTGGVTGFHGHFIIVDDPLDPNVTTSELELKAANAWMNETLSQRKVDRQRTVTILIMQRLHQDDPTASMLERALPGKIKHICLPAEVTDDIKPAKLVKRYKGGVMDPKRFPREVLEENRKKLLDYGYASQFLQNPIARGAGMFQTERLIMEHAPPKKFKMLVRYWDNAATPKGGAFTVGALEGLDYNDEYWILDIVRGQWDSGRREKIKRQTAEMDGINVLIGMEQEPGSGGKESANATVKNLAGFRTRIDVVRGDKILRADAFSQQVNSGHVHILKDKHWTKDYISEMMYFPYSKYKDQIDASSGGFSILAAGGKVVGGLNCLKRKR